MQEVLVTSVGHVIPNVGLVKLPAYLYREKKQKRWSVRCEQMNISKTFNDNVYGGLTNSFYKAVKYHSKHVGSVRIHDVGSPNQKHFQSVNVTGVAGINFIPYVNPMEYKLGYFVIHCMEGVKKNLTMIPGETFQDGLERAIQIRKAAIKSYNHLYRWIGWNPDLYKGLLK